MDTRPLLLSLKPHYADLVFRGLKTAELRRRIPCVENRDVFIYVSSPVRRLRGGFFAEHVWSGSPEHVWREVSELAGVDKRDFDAYYAGRTVAYAMTIADVWEHAGTVDLKALRVRFADFVVPQSWRYVRPEEYRFFRTLRRSASQHRLDSERGDSVLGSDDAATAGGEAGGEVANAPRARGVGAACRQP